MAHVAWQSGPPDEVPDDPQAEPKEKDAEVVDLTKQRLLGWLKGMFGGEKRLPSGES